MFDGRDYGYTFDEACEELPFINDSEEIRNRLISIEWVLGEAIIGVFWLQAFLICSLLFLPAQLLLGMKKAGWIEQLILFVFFIVLGTVIYWLSKFAFWYEIDRHLKTRRFGDPKFKRRSQDSTVS